MSGKLTPKVIFLKSTRILGDSEQDLVTREQRIVLALKKINTQLKHKRKCKLEVMNIKDTFTISHEGYHCGNRTKIKEVNTSSFKYLSVVIVISLKQMRFLLEIKIRHPLVVPHYLLDEYPSHVKYSDGFSCVFNSVLLSFSTTVVDG